MNLSDMITQIMNIATALVPAGTVGLIVTAGAVAAAAVGLLRRMFRSAR